MYHSSLLHQPWLIFSRALSTNHQAPGNTFRLQQSSSTSSLEPLFCQGCSKEANATRLRGCTEVTEMCEVGVHLALQVFGNSPDETAYCRVLLNRETCNDAITMIQPAMQAYSMSSPQPEPVMLDVASVMPDRVLLLDSYFTVVVWHGSTVAQWRKADYHLQEEYAHLKPLMEVSNPQTSSRWQLEVPHV